MQRIGKVKEIHRYPVKSFQGEAVSSSVVEPYGLRGDRSHAFINHDRFDRHLSAKIIPYLLGYHAKFTEDILNNNSPAIEVTTPQQEVYTWDQSLLKHLTDRFSFDLSMENFPMDYEGLTAVDEANLLLTTESSLNALGKIIGESLDMRRFRPNIVLTLDSENPFEEVSWIGHTLQIGNVKIEIYKQCKRCIMIGIDPITTNIDISILRDVSKQLDANFGVYAKVKQTGSIKIGDKVYLI